MSEQRLIDANATRDAMWELAEEFFVEELDNYKFNKLVETVDLQPTIEPTTPQWTSVKDGLPEEKVSVLVAYIGWNDKKVYTDCFARLDDGWKWMLDDEKVLVEITHWMPLPEPPKGE